MILKMFLKCFKVFTQRQKTFRTFSIIQNFCCVKRTTRIFSYARFNWIIRIFQNVKRLTQILMQVTKKRKTSLLKHDVSKLRNRIFLGMKIAIVFRWCQNIFSINRKKFFFLKISKFIETHLFLFLSHRWQLMLSKKKTQKIVIFPQHAQNLH